MPRIRRNIVIADGEKDIMGLTVKERREISWDLYCSGVKKAEISRQVGVTLPTTLKDLRHVAAQKMKEVYDSGYIAQKKVEYTSTLENLISNLQYTIHSMTREGQGHRTAPLAQSVIKAVRTSAEIVGVLDQSTQVEITDNRSGDLADLLGGAFVDGGSSGGCGRGREGFNDGAVVDVEVSETTPPALPSNTDKQRCYNRAAHR